MSSELARPARTRFHRIKCSVRGAKQGIDFLPITRIRSNANADRKLRLLAVIRKIFADAVCYQARWYWPCLR